MSEPANPSDPGGSQTGFIGFFDLLGYKEFIRNNQVKEVAQKVRDILRVCRTSKILNERMEHLFGDHFCEHVIFSDTILIYSNATSDPSALLFTSFCTSLVNGLFRAGYPVRGALASGEFYVEVEQASICLAGAPIVEAYELTDCLDIAGCVVAPSAERLLNLKWPYFQYEVPLNKGRGKQRMFVLNAIADEEECVGISRQVVFDRFGAHNKRIGVDVLPKINNTIAFLEACKLEVARQSETR
jgi:hypothetical protein